MRPFLKAWLTLAALALALPGLAADGDGDGIEDEADNCLLLSNPGQENSDFDRFGNRCDGDLDQDGSANATDRGLVAGEIGALQPRPVADLTGDGTVDQADLDWFDQHLAGSPPGPAGARAHDLDGDGRLDFCAEGPYHACMEACPGGFEACYELCNPGAPPFRHRRDEASQPDLLDNGPLAGDPPPGWSEPNGRYVSYTTELARVGDGVFQWLTWGGAGHGGGELCGSSCVQPDPVPVAPGRDYAWSFYVCAPELPPTTLTVSLSEYDSEGVFLGNASPLNNSKMMSSRAGEWEEVVYFYRPSSEAVASMQPKLYRKVGPGGARRTIFADDFALWELPEEGTRSYRSPPAPKVAFDGARTRVDSLGNVSLFREGGWEDVFPLGIYAHHSRDYQVYSGAGFNLVMNERGFGAEAKPGIDAVSEFNPRGMDFLFVSNRWNDPTGLQLSQALANLTTMTSPVRGELLWDRLLGFNYDNEIFSSCGLTDDETGACLLRMWDAQTAPLAEIFATDRAQNGGLRGAPSYFLNGNPNVARAYSGPGSTVNVEGDRRMDVTGSYGAANVGHLARIHDQESPSLAVQIQTSAGDRYRSIAWAGIGHGARMIGTWRDWLPAAASHGQVYKAPELRLCGAEDFGLRPRLNYYDPPGQIVEGTVSGARAEILKGPTAYGSCAGEGASYKVHMVAGEFASGEGLRDAGTGEPVAGATVNAVDGSFLVDYEITITERGWYAGIPPLRREIDALGPVLRESHWTEWDALCRATAPSLPGAPVVPEGNEGVACGKRTHEGRAYLVLANTWHEVDPYAAWDEQIGGTSLQVEVTLSGLGYDPTFARPFDRGLLEFTGVGELPVSQGRFSVDLPPLGVAILRLDDSPAAASEASDTGGGMAPFRVSKVEGAAETVALSWEPACRAADHALYAGPLGEIADYAYDRIACGLGTGGSAELTLEPGSRFLLLVGRSAENDGSAGRDSRGSERPEPPSSLPCHLPRLLGGPCP